MFSSCALERSGDLGPCLDQIRLVCFNILRNLWRAAYLYMRRSAKCRPQHGQRILLSHR